MESILTADFIDTATNQPMTGARLAEARWEEADRNYRHIEATIGAQIALLEGLNARADSGAVPMSEAEQVALDQAIEMMRERVNEYAVIRAKAASASREADADAEPAVDHQWP